VVETLSIIAALFAAVETAALIVLHVLPTGYDPIRDAVSDYGVGPYRPWFWLQAVAGGLAWLAPRGGQRRPLRRLGRARAVCDRDPGRVQFATRTVGSKAASLIRSPWTFARR
jgi:hypothetical protein